MREELMSLGLVFIQAIVVPLLGILAAWAGIQLREWLKTKTKITAVRGMIDRVYSVTELAVKEVEQSFLSNLTKIDAEHLKQAKDQALASIRSHFGKKGLLELQVILGLADLAAVDVYLTTALEAQVYDLKRDHAIKRNPTVPGGAA